MSSNAVCKNLSFNECELFILRQSIDNAKIKNTQEELKSPEIKIIFDLLEEFIIRKKLILYGGTAINNILPKKDQFYDKKYIMPDYDLYSPNALKDAKELADLYLFHGFKETEAKIGVHEGTYKVYVNFIPVADITFVPKYLFDAIKEDAIEVNGMLHSPPNLLRMSMYLELSRPFGDASRWEKVLKRLILLNKNYPLKVKNCINLNVKNNIPNKRKIYDVVKKIFINEGCVFFGAYALSKYGQHMPSKINRKLKDNPDFDVLHTNPMEVAKKIKSKLNENDFSNCIVIHHQKIGEIIPTHYEIKLGKKSIAFIYEPIACHSYNVIHENNNAIKIATIDTMLSFYLAFLYANTHHYDKRRILCMSNYLFEVQSRNRLAQKGVLKRFSINCYGHQKTLKEIFSDKNDKFKNIKKNSKDYEKYFLRYRPNNDTRKMNKLFKKMSKTNRMKIMNAKMKSSKNKNRYNNKKTLKNKTRKTRNNMNFNIFEN